MKDARSDLVMQCPYRWAARLILLIGLLPTNARAQESMSLYLESKPVGEVFVNGGSVGETPTLIKVQLGADLWIEIRADGFIPWEQVIVAEPGADTMVVHLLPAEGPVRLLNLPREARVWLDDVEIEALAEPLTIHGEHDLRIRMPNGRIIRSSIMPLHGAERAYRLERRRWSGSALFRSLVVPGWGQYRSGAHIKAVVLLLGAATAGVLSYHAQSRHASNIRAYKEAQKQYQRAILEAEAVHLRMEMHDRYGDVLASNRRREIMFTLVGGIYALNVLDAFLLHSFVGRLVPVPNNAHAGFTLDYGAGPEGLFISGKLSF